jgi:hypothetical protein
MLNLCLAEEVESHCTQPQAISLWKTEKNHCTQPQTRRLQTVWQYIKTYSQNTSLKKHDEQQG